MSDEQEKQEKKSNLTGWATLLVAVATVLGAIGFNQFFPDVVKRIFLSHSPQTISQPSPPSPELVITSTPTLSISSTPTPSISSTPTPAPSITSNTTLDKVIQTVVDSSNNVTWELNSCLKKQSNIVSCNFSLTVTEDRDYGISLNNVTKLVDSTGVEYYGNKVQIAKKTSGVGGQLVLNMAKGAHYQTTLDFTDVPNSISQATLIQITTPWSQQVKFRNVPIN